jgi:hypothetical protein
MPMTKDYLLKFGAIKATGNSPAAGALYGGATNPTLGANNQRRYDEVDISDTPETYEDMSKTGDLGTREHEIAAIPVSYTLKTKVYPETTGLELFGCFGYADLGGPRLLGGKRKHIFELRTAGKDQTAYRSDEAALATANASLSPAYNANDRINPYLHVLRQLGDYDETAINSAVKEFTISGEPKSAIMLEMSGPCERVVRDTNKTQGNALTEPTAQDGVYFMTRHCRAFFGQYVAPIGSADAVLNEVDLISFSIKTAFGMAEDIFTTRSALNRSEPVSTDKLDVDIDLTINRHEGVDYKLLEQAGTITSLKITATRGTDIMHLLIPEAQIMNAKEEIGDGSRWTLQLKARRPKNADPFIASRGGASAVALIHRPPFYVVLDNDQTTNYMRVS